MANPLNINDHIRELNAAARRTHAQQSEKQAVALRQRRERESAARAADHRQHPVASQIAEMNRLVAAQPPPGPVPRPAPAPASPPRQDIAGVAALNAQIAAVPPRPRPAPAPVGLSRLDVAAAARSPAVQEIVAANARGAAEAKRQAERAQEQARERDRLAQIRAEILAQHAREAEHERAITAAIRAMAEDWIFRHPEI